jgi:electron transport complex protein RnfD
VRTFATAPAPHLPPRRGVRDVMALVLAALAPGIALHVAWFGPGLGVQIVLSTAFALAFEAAMLRLRERPLRPALGDLTAPLTAVLFALSVPPLAPWWLAAIGMASAIVLAKQLFGGLGHNLFNPAMVGVAVVVLCFPREFTHWLPPGGAGDAPGLGDTLRAIFAGAAPGGGWDTVAQATPLDTLRGAVAGGATLGETLRAPAFGAFGARGWEQVAIAYALGGVFLLWRRVIAWQVPVAVLATTVLLALPAWLSDPDLHPFPLQHLAGGGLVLAAFFVATDPVTGCTTPRGRLLFGAGVAALTLAIRRWGATPDGVAFAVLLMNCAAPWIDLHTRPRIAGEGARP